jgi:hypothetical protein
MSVAGYIGKNCPAPLKGMTGVKAPRIPGEDDKKEDAELKSLEARTGNGGIWEPGRLRSGFAGALPIVRVGKVVCRSG